MEEIINYLVPLILLGRVFCHNNRLFRVFFTV